MSFERLCRYYPNYQPRYSFTYHSIRTLRTRHREVIMNPLSFGSFSSRRRAYFMYLSGGDIDAANSYGETAIHLAIRSYNGENGDIIISLVVLGADVNSITDDGRALEYAYNYHLSNKYYLFLIENGAFEDEEISGR